MSVQRFDIGEIHGDAVDDAGMMRAPARLTRTGVFSYRLPDGTTRRELRHPSEVFDAASVATLAQVPVTLGHPPEWVTADNAKKYGVGSTGEQVEAEGGKYLRARLLVSDAGAVQAVRSGLAKQTSCGYTCTLDMTPGVHEGEPYDAIQRGMRYNHVALVPSGRAGPEVRVMDGAQVAGEEPAKVQTMAKLKIDAVEYEVPDGAATAIAAKLDALDTQIKAKDAEIKAAKDAAAATQAKLDAAPDVAKLRGEVEAQVRARLTLESSARGVLGDAYKCDGKSDDEVRRAVIAKVDPAAKLDGKGDAYVAARFDLALDAHAADAARKQKLGQTIAAGVTTDADADPTGWKAARKEQAERLAHAGDPTKSW